MAGTVVAHDVAPGLARGVAGFRSATEGEPPSQLYMGQGGGEGD